MNHADLIKGRSCGTCMVCCIVPGIDQKDVQKKSNTPCRHCGSGCGIYDARPNVCRDFFCAWRYLEDWGDAWRPDRSGVFARFEKTPTGQVLNILLMDRPAEIAGSAPFINFIAGLGAAAMPVYVGLAGPVGGLPVRALIPGAALNAALRQNQIGPLLQQAIAAMQAQSPRMHILAHAGNDLTGAAAPHSEPPSCDGHPPVRPRPV